MPIPVTCVCGKHLLLKDEWAGRRVRCARCGSFLTVPSRSEAAPPANLGGGGFAKLRRAGWWGAILLGVLLMAAGGGIAWYLGFDLSSFFTPTESKQAQNKPGQVVPKEKPTQEPLINPAAVKNRPIPPPFAKEPRSPRRFIPAKYIGELPSAESKPAREGGLELSGDGNFLLSHGSLWEVPTGQRLRQLVQPGDPFWYWGFMPDNKHVFGVSQRGESSLRIWNIDTGLEARSFRLCLRPDQGRVAHLTLSSDGRRALAAFTHENAPEVHLWDVELGQHVRAFAGHGPGTIFQTLFSPDERYILSCGEDKTLRLWDLNSGKKIHVFDRHTDAVVGAAFSPDGKQILSASWDGTLRLWDVYNGRKIRRFDLPDDPHLSAQERRLHTVVFSPDGKQAASGGADGIIRLWDVAAGKEMGRFQGHTQGIAQVAFTAKGRELISAGRDATVRWWDVKTGKELRRLNQPAGWAIGQQAFFPDPRRRKLEKKLGHSAGQPFQPNLITEEPPSPKNTQYFFRPGLFDNRLHLWDLSILGFERHSFTGFQGKPGQMTLSADAKVLYYFYYVKDGKDNHTLRLCDLYTGKEIRRLPSVPDQPKCLVFTPDARHALVGYANGVIRLWDVDKGNEARSYHTPQSWVDGLAFSPQGDQFASYGGQQDFSLHLWDVKTGRERQRLDGHTSVITSMAYAPDGKRLASVSRYDRSLRLWDLSTGQHLPFLLHGPGDTDLGNCLAWSPDGQFLAVGGLQGPVRLLDAKLGKEGKEIRRFFGLAGLVQGVAFSPDSRLVAAGGANGLTIVWETNTGKERRRFDRYTSDVSCLQFSPDGRFLACGSQDRKIYLWDLEPRPLVSYQGHSARVECVAIAPDGRSLLTGSRDKTVRLWNLTSGETIHDFPGHTDTVWCVAFSPVEAIIASGSSDRSVRLWDEKTGQLIHTFNGHAAAVTAVTFSADGQYLLSGSADKVAILWDLRTKKEIDRRDGSAEAMVNAEAHSGDGQFILRTDGASSNLYFWDLKKANEGPLVLQGHKGGITCVALAPDKKYALSGSRDQTLRLWDLAQGKELRQLEGHEDQVLAIAFAPQGHRALSAGADKTLRLWDIAQGQEIRKFPGHADRVTCLAISPDGRRALSGSADKTVCLWDLDTGQLLKQMKGHADVVMSLAFSADGSHFLCGSRDGTARCWEVLTGQKKWESANPGSPIFKVAFSLDDRFALIHSADGTGRRWDLEKGELQALFPAAISPLPSIAFVGEGKLLQPARFPTAR